MFTNQEKPISQLGPFEKPSGHETKLTSKASL
jgi:hypothetical protein